jgi:hypothetical protein
MDGVSVSSERAEPENGLELGAARVFSREINLDEGLRHWLADTSM